MENNSKIIKIINKYIEILSRKLDVLMDSIGLEEHTTITTLAPHDFFEGEEGRLKDFGRPSILFNDLKNSKELLEELEKEGILYYYSYYMYYSSKMLAEILDLFDGKMIECTGDGNYSIFEEKAFSFTRQVSKEYEYINERYYNTDILNDYLNNFERKENCFLNYPPSDTDERLRQLFFYIFALFNIEINKLLPNDFDYKFLTRIGCATGECQIIRIENSHIKQDKLIGSVVHKSAHQASGKI